MAEDINEKRLAVAISEPALRRADEYIDRMKREKGITLSRGAVFAIGMDLLAQKG